MNVSKPFIFEDFFFVYTKCLKSPAKWYITHIPHIFLKNNIYFLKILKKCDLKTNHKYSVVLSTSA